MNQNVGMKMEMYVNVMKIGGNIVNNPHPKDSSKNPAVAGFFVSPTFVLTFHCENWNEE